MGGSTALFGAALLRPGPSDFEPGRHYADYLPDHLAEWPIQYEELEPISRRLVKAFHRESLSPFPLPLAIDFRRCLRCPTCPGYVCPTGARASRARSRSRSPS